MKGRVRNKTYPKGSHAEHVIACERYTFASRYFHGVQSTINRPPRTKDYQKYFGAGVDSKYPRDLIQQAHIYVLNNIVCIEPYRK